MLEKNKDGVGLVILSMDGGGIRGLSSLLILRECMGRLQQELGLSKPPNVHEYFDVIGGTGTGGISAVMLGRLKLPLDQAIEQFAKLGKNVFSDKKNFGSSSSGAFKSTKLRQALKDIIRTATGNENETMMDRLPDAGGCKTVVFAMSKHNMNAGILRAFRSYQAATNQMPDCAIWEALCAATAHPDLFKSMTIGKTPFQESFVDGALGCSNPLAHVLSETKLMYPGRHVGCIVSIGSGHARTIHIPKSSSFQRLLPTHVLEVMKGIATDSERVAEDMAIRFSGTHDVYFRFNVDQGLQCVELGDWERLGEVTSHTRAYIGHPVVSGSIGKSAIAIKAKAKKILVAHIDGQLPVATVDQINYTDFKMCPLPTSLFVGREELVQRGASYFLGDAANQTVFVLHGLGGAGKTQTALQIVKQTQDTWLDIVYVDAASTDTLEASLTEFATFKRIGDTHKVTLRWLATHNHRWLLVLDNVDNPDINILDYLPQCSHGSVLITTRNKELVDLAIGPDSDRDVSLMEPAEALRLLLKASRMENRDLTEDDSQVAGRLVEAFGYLPLAIVQAGGYIHKNRCSFSQYYELYSNYPEKMLRQHNQLRMRLDKYERTIFDTWVPSYTLLSLRAQQMFWLFAYMQRDRITQEIFRRASLNANAFDPVIPLLDSEAEIYNDVKGFLSSFLDSNGDWDTDAFLTVIGEILSYSLVEFDRANQVYVLHPLVQTWVRAMIPHQEKAGLHTAYVLASSLNWFESDKDYVFCRSIQLHLAAVLPHCSEISSDVIAYFAAVFVKNGCWGRASSLQESVLQTRRQALGDEHPATLLAMSNLAGTYHEQGRLKEAEALQLCVIDIGERELVEDNRLMLTVKSNLAATYFSQGLLEQAAGLQVQVLDSRKRLLGEKNPDTLNAMYNLALTYLGQGLLKKGEDLLVRVLDERRQELGENHPFTLAAMSNLANTYALQNKEKQAEELQQRALDGRKQELGEDHPDSLLAMVNLSRAYSQRGLHKQAEELLVQALRAMRDVFGKEHPHTLSAEYNLAMMHLGEGRLKDAEELGIQVLEKRKRVLGEGHPDTLDAMRCLAEAYRAQRLSERAVRVELEMIDVKKRVLGEGHPDTLSLMHKLGQTYLKQYLTKQAAEVLGPLFIASKKSLGEEHPETLKAMVNLGEAYYQQGCLDQAERLQAGALEIGIRVLGMEHPTVLMALFNTATINLSRGLFKQAEERYTKVLDARKRMLGDEHPDTLSSMTNLAIVYREQGHLKQAEMIQVKALEASKRVLGLEHRDTLAAMYNLACTYNAQQSFKQAEKLMEQALDAMKRVLSENDPHTLSAMNALAAIYSAQGLQEQATRLFVKLLNTRKRVLGPTHPYTLNTLNNLAACYFAQGLHEKAVDLQVQLVDARKQVYGRDHPQTQRAISMLRTILESYTPV